MSKKVKISKKKLNKLRIERKQFLQGNFKLSYEREILRNENARLKGNLENLCNVTNFSLVFPKPEHSELPPLLTVEYSDGSKCSVPSTGSDKLSMRHDVMCATLLRIFPSETINALFKKCDEASDKLEEFLDDCCCDCDCEDCYNCNECEDFENELCGGECECCSENDCPQNPAHTDNEETAVPDGAAE